MRALPLAVFGVLAVSGAARAQDRIVPPEPLPAGPNYHVTVGIEHLAWSGTGLTGATGPMITASRHVVGPVRAAFSLATASGNTIAGSGTEPARHWIVGAGFDVAPSFAVGRRALVPFAGIGIGTVVSDPDNAGDQTRSQNSWEWRVGLDLEVAGPMTLGAAFQGLHVWLHDAAASGGTVTAVERSANAISVRAGVRF